MTTIKKYFAPVLVLSAALLLLSCGKDDNGNGGGNGGGEGGDPNPPVPTEKTTVWDSNSLHFAKLFGEVQKVDTLVRRRQHGPVRPQRLYYLVQDQRVRRREQPVEYAFQCTYNADSLVTSITSDQMTVTFLYGDHGKYIEVEQDIFEYNQLDYLYVFQPRFLKNLTSVVINAQGQRLEFGFEVSGDRMTVKAPDGTVWSETTYAGEFPAQRVTSTAARIQDGRRGKLCQGGRAIRQSQLHGRSDRDVPVQRRERQPALVQGRGGQNLRG